MYESEFITNINGKEKSRESKGYATSEIQFVVNGFTTFLKEVSGT